MTGGLRSDLIPALSTYLPENGQAELIAVLDPNDIDTHYDLYFMLRRNFRHVPPEMLRDFTAGIKVFLANNR